MEASTKSNATRIPTDATAAREAEYNAIRKGVGISDLSDMGKLRVRGTNALALLDRVVAGNVDQLVENSIRWTVILDQRGHVLADVQIYNDFDEYFVTCAGPLRETVLDALQQHSRNDVEIIDLTETLAAVAVEGPQAMRIPPAIAGIDASGLALLKFTRCDIQGNEVLISRIGYTGEFGYIFFVAPTVVGSLIDQIRAVAPEAVLCGRAVQNILRLEVRAFDPARHILNHESALEAGLHWMIDFRKPYFQGRDAVMAEKASGIERRLVAFVLEDGYDVIERGAALRDGGRKVGYVADCSHSPTLEQTIGLAYLDADYAWVGITLEIDTRAGIGRARTVSAPFLITESTEVATR